MARKRMHVDMSNVELSDKTFPYSYEYQGETITLRAEKGRRRIVYDHTKPDGKRVKKVVPESLGAAGFVPESGLVPTVAVTWAQDTIVNTVRAREKKDSDRQVIPAVTTIGLIFNEFREHALSRYPRKTRNDLALTMRTVEAALGRSFTMARWDNVARDKIVQMRTAGCFLRTEDGGKRWHRPASKTAVRNLFAWLSVIFKWALARKHPDGSGRWMLDADPFLRVKKPKKKGAARVSIASHDLYETLMRYADQVDPHGRFRMILADARWSGHRLGAICHLRRSDLILTMEEIEAALRRSLCRWYEPDQVPAIAKLFSPFGAIYRRFDIQKQGRSGEAETVQYDRVVPLGPAHRAEIDHFLEAHWTPLGLPSSGPMFVKESNIHEPLYVDLPQKWFLAALDLAGRAGETVPDLVRTRFHGFRRLRRTELKQAKIHDKDVAYVCGWTIASQEGVARGAMNGTYLGFSAPELLEASCAGVHNRAPDARPVLRIEHAG